MFQTGEQLSEGRLAAERRQDKRTVPRAGTRLRFLLQAREQVAHRTGVLRKPAAMSLHNCRDRVGDQQDTQQRYELLGINVATLDCERGLGAKLTCDLVADRHPRPHARRPGAQCLRALECSLWNADRVRKQGSVAVN
jgi:hypothetical protein